MDQNDLSALLASAKGGDLAAYAAIADRLEEIGQAELASRARWCVRGNRVAFLAPAALASIRQDCQALGLIRQ